MAFLFLLLFWYQDVFSASGGGFAPWVSINTDHTTAQPHNDRTARLHSRSWCSCAVVLCGRRADTVRRLHEDRTYRKDVNALAMGPSRRTLKHFITKIQWGKIGLLVTILAHCRASVNGHQPADRTLRTPKLLCGRCAVVRSVFTETAPHDLSALLGTPPPDPVTCWRSAFTMSSHYSEEAYAYERIPLLNGK